MSTVPLLCGITDQTILANRPDIVLHDKKRRLAYWLI